MTKQEAKVFLRKEKIKFSKEIKYSLKRYKSIRKKVDPSLQKMIDEQIKMLEDYIK